MSEFEFASANLTAGQLNALVKRVGGEETVRKILSGAVKVTVEEIVRTFPTWRTLTLGTGLKTADDFRKAIAAAEMKVSEWASDILGKSEFTVAETQTEVELVRVSVGDLGFKNGARYDVICAKAQELGLDLCPAEAGPALRLVYKDQPLNEWLRIAMKPIRGSDGSLDVFDVGHGEDGLWLDTYYGGPGLVWRAGYEFVFVRRIGSRN